MNHHGVKHRKFGRRTGHRSAMFCNLMKQLIEHESISTTLPKAKEIRPMLEKLVTRARGEQNLHNFRILLKKFRGDEVITKKLINEIAPRYKERNGGYLRIVKTERRTGDLAPMSIIQFVRDEQRIVAKKEKKAK